ncbi:hypothetical protein [Rubrobacter aplysinae]|nr:hypothetical protein [Rubrobacter aplysinae]
MAATLGMERRVTGLIGASSPGARALVTIGLERLGRFNRFNERLEREEEG